MIATIPCGTKRGASVPLHRIGCNRTSSSSPPAAACAAHGLVGPQQPTGGGGAEKHKTRLHKRRRQRTTRQKPDTGTVIPRGRGRGKAPVTPPGLPTRQRAPGHRRAKPLNTSVSDMHRLLNALEILCSTVQYKTIHYTEMPHQTVKNAVTIQYSIILQSSAVPYCTIQYNCNTVHRNTV